MTTLKILAVAATMALGAGASEKGTGDFIIVAELGPEFENPPVMGVDAHGSAGLFYDAATQTLSWSIEYTGMTSTPSAGHIHGPATPDMNAGILLDLLANSTGAESPIVGEAVIDSATLSALMASEAYINLHTPTNSSGEVRGNLVVLGDRRFESAMDPDQETGTVSGDVSAAGGQSVFDYDSAQDRLSWVITHSGMTEDPSGGHIHGPAEPGVNAGIVLNLIANSNGNASPIIGSIDGPGIDLLGMMYGRRGYVNLHTPTNSAGEIRGQILPIVFMDGFEGESP